jgi:hypothetical protein
MQKARKVPSKRRRKLAHDTRLRSVIQQPSNLRRSSRGRPRLGLDPAALARMRTRLAHFFEEHGHKLWWLHSGYALAFGAGVVAFAKRGFEHARWLAVTVGLAWLLVVFLFRVSGSSRAGSSTEDVRPRAGFYVVTYALKNLYQGMLFFLLPFYWKSATTDAANVWFVCLLALCAVVSAIDIVFDRVLMRWRFLASAFHGITLFACLNLVIPALFPDTRTLWSLLAAAAVATVSFWTLHASPRQFKRRLFVLAFALSLAAGVAVVYWGRALVPPVPMYVDYAAVGPEQLPDGRLAMEVTKLHPSVIRELIAVTDVVVPGGKGDRLRHIWRHRGREVHRSSEETRVEAPTGVVRLQSSLNGKDLPDDLVGPWRVDVETDDGQLVGRAEFQVVP